jgi:sulfate transport system permease protein
VSPRPSGGAVALPRPGLRLRFGTGWLTPALASSYLLLIVLIPLAAIVWQLHHMSVGEFWDRVTDPQAKAALKLTLISSFIVVGLNAVFGTITAWVLARDEFRGKRLMESIIELPFALPTVVAGATLLALYGPQSPLGVTVTFTRTAVVLAMMFETLPFVVRAVQPVLLEMEQDVEEAAASLGAGSFTIARRIILPTIMPALLAGSALGFARCVGEYGAVVLISGNIPLKTEVASVAIFGRIENADINGAVALAVLLLIISLAVLLAVSMVSQLQARRTSSAG